MRPYLENTQHKKRGLVEWLKVKALSSSLSTGKKKKKATAGVSATDDKRRRKRWRAVNGARYMWE
jgi:hypothetical protein